MTNVNIFLADDDKEDCSFFTEALHELYPGAQLTIAKDGEQLMANLNALRVLPDILFLDLNMPKKNGFSCLVEIRESLKLSAIPVVILSTSSNEEKKLLLLSTGASSYFSKPDNFVKLKEIIETSILEIRPKRPAVPEHTNNERHQP